MRKLCLSIRRFHLWKLLYEFYINLVYWSIHWKFPGTFHSVISITWSSNKSIIIIIIKKRADTKYQHTTLNINTIKIYIFYLDHFSNRCIFIGILGETLWQLRMLLNIMVQRQALLLYIWKIPNRSFIHIVTEVLHDFPQLLQENVRIVSQNSKLPRPSKSFPIHYSQVSSFWCYVTYWRIANKSTNQSIYLARCPWCN
jgi:hypothetical protein